MGVTVKNIGRLQAKLSKLDPLTRGAISRGVQKAAAKVEGDAKLITPVDTGALRSSINVAGKSTPNGAEASIGTNLEYAAHVEFGTSRAKAQPYLQPALQKNKKPATQIVLNEVRNAYKGI